LPPPLSYNTGMRSRFMYWLLYRTPVGPALGQGSPYRVSGCACSSCWPWDWCCGWCSGWPT